MLLRVAPASQRWVASVNDAPLAAEPAPGVPRARDPRDEIVTRHTASGVVHMTVRDADAYGGQEWEQGPRVADDPERMRAPVQLHAARRGRSWVNKELLKDIRANDPEGLVALKAEDHHKMAFDFTTAILAQTGACDIRFRDSIAQTVARRWVEYVRELLRMPGKKRIPRYMPVKIPYMLYLVLIERKCVIPLRVLCDKADSLSKFRVVPRRATSLVYKMCDVTKRGQRRPDVGVAVPEFLNRFAIDLCLTDRAIRNARDVCTIVLRRFKIDFDQKTHDCRRRCENIAASILFWLYRTVYLAAPEAERVGKHSIKDFRGLLVHKAFPDKPQYVADYYVGSIMKKVTKAAFENAVNVKLDDFLK